MISDAAYPVKSASSRLAIMRSGDGRPSRSARQSSAARSAAASYPTGTDAGLISRRAPDTDATRVSYTAAM